MKELTYRDMIRWKTEIDGDFFIEKDNDDWSKHLYID